MRRALAAVVAGALLLGSAAAALARGMPTFAELESAGATVGEIRIDAQDIFDTTDPEEDKALFRLANRVHVQTRPEVIRRALLFAPGDPVSVRLIDESERVLRGNRYLYDVQFHVLAVHDGVADIGVVTRDTWSLDVGASVGRAGGANSSTVHLREYNLFGTGVSLGVSHVRNVDRTGDEFTLSNDRILGSRASFALSHATNSDGSRDAISLVRPFYALDARWAAGASALRDDRIDSVYQAGRVASEYRHRQQRAEVFGGWSDGLVDGRVHRTSVGLALSDDRYAREDGLTAPAQLPSDQRLVAPFVRYELIQDRFERELNRNLIGRPEFFALGLAARVQLGWAAPALGSSRSALLVDASVSRGFEGTNDDTLMAAAALSGQIVGGRPERQRLGVQAQYYRPLGPHKLFYVGAWADVLTRPEPADLLMLGGDDGLRGYPLRYQSGTRRALLTVEQRFYTDLYVWRLFRVGGALFGDVGRAWGGPLPNLENPGWLSDVGAGLRIVSTRSAFSNVLHVDLAFPLRTTPDISRAQVLVKVRTSF